MSVALRGNVKDFGIAEVFQLIGQQRKTGILELSDGDEQVQLVFDRGAVVEAAPVGGRPHEGLGEMLVRCGLLSRQRVEKLHRECAASAQTLPRRAVERCGLDAAELASIEDLLTRETLLRILRWSSGSFDFRAQPVEHERQLGTLLGAEQILMDGLRMVDEWQSFCELVPSQDLVFQQTAPFEEFRPRADSPQQLEAIERVYRLVDGRTPVDRIVDLSRLGSFDATRALASLRKAGVVEALDPAGAGRLRPRTRLFDRGQLRAVVPALIGLALLAVVSAAANLRPGAPVEPRGVAIDRAPLEALRLAHEVRGVRHALDAYRFLDGRWPEALPELAERGLPGAQPLASPGAQAYYYATREGDALLLAPER